MKIIKYRLDKNGYIDACGYFETLPFEVDKDTPFQTIQGSMKWKKINDVWIEYDPEWTFEEFDVKVTIDQTHILDTDDYINLIGHVKGLIQSKKAKMETIGNDRVMYFERLLTAHENLLKKDNKVIIKKK